MQTMTSIMFNKNVSLAKRSSHNGPVFITDRGRIAYVLMRYEDYIESTNQKNLAQLLACEESADIEFDPEPMNFHAKDVDF